MEKLSLLEIRDFGFSLRLERGPFQNNGASPWYTMVGLGTIPQPLKFSFDTGSNFIWVTSSLCGNGCYHFGGGRFYPEKSTTFQNIPLPEPTPEKPDPHTVDFGPWGEMQVDAGRDYFTLLQTKDDSNISIHSDTYLSTSYEGQQFDELDWDGGIGVPAIAVVPEEATGRTSSINRCELGMKDTGPSFHFFENVMKNGYVRKDMPFVAFSTNVSSAKNEKEVSNGTMSMGQLDESYQDSLEYLFLPWEAYSISAVSYLWTCKMKSFTMDGKVLLKSDADNTAFFSLDSGASQFKGDATAMFKAYLQSTLEGGNLEIEVGETDKEEAGKLVIPPSIYNVKIEEGEFKGKVVSQFVPLEGVPNLALVGSVLMDHLYTVYEYKVDDSKPDLSLLPVGMWIFNKTDSIKVIQTKQTKTASIFNNLKKGI